MNPQQFRALLAAIAMATNGGNVQQAVAEADEIIAYVDAHPPGAVSTTGVFNGTEFGGG